MKKYTVSIIQPSGYIHSGAFLELAELVVFGLRKLGIQADLKWNSIDSGCRNILFGVHLLNTDCIQQLPRDSVLVNTEQLSSVTSGWNSNILKWFRSGFELWDYSDSNIVYLKDAGISNVKKLGLGYVEGLRRIIHGNKDVDVLFYGSLNQRRSDVLSKIEWKGFKVKSLFGVYGRERDNWIGRSKLVLNVHYMESKIFEIVRVFYLMTNSVPVVGEVGSQTKIDKLFLDGVAHTDYDFIPDLIDSILKDPLRLNELARKGFETISNYPQEDYLRELVSPSPVVAVPQNQSVSKSKMTSHAMSGYSFGQNIVTQPSSNVVPYGFSIASIGKSHFSIGQSTPVEKLTPDVLMDRAKKLQQGGDLDAVLTVCDEILKDYSDYSPALNLKGEILLQMGKGERH
ncbi:MAG: hypothetical protein KGI52_09925 [Burkholderiales bacterium]|nr:hypothetical protein [Burkholderiales bacterium]